jgi:hypothetical protein
MKGNSVVGILLIAEKSDLNCRKAERYYPVGDRTFGDCIWDEWEWNSNFVQLCMWFGII